MMPVEDTIENMYKCICSSCPSFAGKPYFYCAKGKAEHPSLHEGCFCKNCRVWKENGLEKNHPEEAYFCENGKAT